MTDVVVELFLASENKDQRRLAGGWFGWLAGKNWLSWEAPYRHSTQIVGSLQPGQGKAQVPASIPIFLQMPLQPLDF